MKYISEVDFRKQLTDLLKELKNAKEPKQQQKVQDEISYLKKLRYESELEERFQAMSERRR